MKKRRLSILTFMLLGLSLALMGRPRQAHAVQAKHPELLDASVQSTCRSQTLELLRSDELPSDGPIGTSAALSDDADSALRQMSAEEADAGGYLPLVTIVVGFEGQPYDATYDWGSFVFQGTTSLRQYYRDMSNGKLSFEPVQETSAYGVDGNTNEPDAANDGIIHVSLDYEKIEPWHVEDTKDEDLELFTCLSDALVKAGEHMDFASYDSNGDGAIQTSELALSFVIAGKDASTYEGEYTPEGEFVWPHTGYFNTYDYEETPDAPVVDGVAIDAYVLIAEHSDESGELEPEEPGALAHEMGHYIGLPDLYHTRLYLTSQWSRYDVGYLSLMDSGNYGVDLDGNYRPFSLDIWSRMILGWVDPQVIDENSGRVTIAGSLADPVDADGNPIALRINTNNEGEYYLVENRRFAGWDEGMGTYYPSAAKLSEDGEDCGGGLLLWHIDDGIVEAYSMDNEVNNADHHPGVMPVYLEEDAKGNLGIMGTYVDTERPFFDSTSPLAPTLLLPQYGTVANDRMKDRTQTSDLALALESESAPTMELHLHRSYCFARWADDYSSADLVGLCIECGGRDVYETTTNITSEVIEKPSSTEMGAIEYTAHFKVDGYEDTTYDVIPPLDGSVLEARDAALAELSDLIIQASGTLAQGSYTGESFEALKDAIGQANALFGDDTATEEDVKAAQTELLSAWRLLEPMNAASAGDAEREDAAWRQAVYDLAEVLSDIYGSIDEEAYRPAAYEAFMEVADRAFAVLENEAATTAELRGAKTEVVRARTSLFKNGKRIQLKTAVVSGLADVTYNGAAHSPLPVVTLGGRTLVAGIDYELTYANNTKAGTATVVAAGIGDYIGEKSASFSIAKAPNTLAASGKTAKVSFSKLKTKAQGLSVSKTIKFANKGQGTLRFTKVGGNKNISVNKKTGLMTVKKGLKKGTYKVKIRIRAAGNANYLAMTSKTLTVGIRVA